MKQSKSQITIIYTLTCLALVPIFLLSGYYIYHSRNKSVEDKVDKLKAIALSKQVTLENHLTNYISSLEVLANSEIFGDEMKKKIYNGSSQSLIHDFQEKMWGAFHHVFVADTNGNIIISPHHGDNTKSTHLNHSISSSKYFKESLNSTQVTGFFGFEETTHYHQLVMVPIKKDGETLGVIISEITIKFYIDLLRKDFELGETGQIYLSTLNKERVVHLKETEILKLSSSFLDSALSEGRGLGIADGKLSVFLRSKRFPWVLAVEIDEDEVLMPINTNVKYISIAYLVFTIIFLLVFRYIVALLKKPVQVMSERIASISTEASKNTLELNQKSSELVDGSITLAEALTENQGQLESVISGLKEDRGLIESSLKKSDEVKNVASRGQGTVDDLNVNIENVVDSNELVQSEVSGVMTNIFEISDSIKLIQEKTNLINDIVFQTKLLSFNASVEAARAGEHGKGFAVVAEEVGNLADMSGNAAVEIHEMIEESVKKVENIVEKSKKDLEAVIERSKENTNKSKKSVEECHLIFKNILEGIQSLHIEIGNVSERSNQKVVVIDEVNERFLSLRTVSDNSSEVAEYVKVHMHKLKNDAQKLMLVSAELKNKFSS